MPCIGSRNANPSTFGAGAHECRNLIWRTAACRATSQLSVSRKTAHQSFVISLQSRRFACAMPRIAQGKSISIRSGRSRVQKSYLAHRCRAARRLSFPLAGKPHIKVCDFTSIATICVCHASDRATQIHQHSERALSSAEIVFDAPLRAGRRLSFPLAGKPHIKAL